MTHKPSKYRNVKTEVDGITFDSKLEAKRYSELKLLERAKEIWGLKLQPAFPLEVKRPYVEAQVIGKYKADFAYHDPSLDRLNDLVIEDTKGMKTPLYKWKKKHFEAQYGISITEITK